MYFKTSDVRRIRIQALHHPRCNRVILLLLKFRKLGSSNVLLLSDAVTFSVEYFFSFLNCT